MVGEALRRLLEAEPELTPAEVEAAGRLDQAWFTEQQERGRAWNQELQRRLQPLPTSSPQAPPKLLLRAAVGHLLAVSWGGRRRRRAKR